MSQDTKQLSQEEIDELYRQIRSQVAKLREEGKVLSKEAHKLINEAEQKKILEKLNQLDD